MTDDRRWEQDLRRVAEELPPSGPCPPAEQYARFYVGELAVAEADRLREHLASCRACLDVAGEARRFIESMREPAPIAASRPARRPRRWLPAAAAAVLLVAAATVLVPRMSPRRATPAPPVVVYPAPYDPRSVVGGAVFRGNAGDAFARAMERYLDRDWRGAERALESYVAGQPADDEARFYLAVCRLLLGNDADAWIDLEHLATRAEGPLREEVLWYRALAALRTGRSEEALGQLRAISARPGPHRDDARGLIDGPASGGQ